MPNWLFDFIAKLKFINNGTNLIDQNEQTTKIEADSSSSDDLNKTNRDQINNKNELIDYLPKADLTSKIKFKNVGKSVNVSNQSRIKSAACLLM